MLTLQQEIRMPLAFSTFIEKQQIQCIRTRHAHYYFICQNRPFLTITSK